MTIRQKSEAQTMSPILLVEDDEVDVMNVKRAFRKVGIKVPLLVAENGLEALEMLREKLINTLPKAVLLDINMPRMNGLEFLKAVREDESLRHLNVYILSTSSNENDKSQAFFHNVAGYIVKPVSSELFVGMIKTLWEFWQINEFPNQSSWQKS